MKKVMTNRIRKTLGRLKLGLRRVTKSAELVKKYGVQL